MVINSFSPRWIGLLLGVLLVTGCDLGPSIEERLARARVSLDNSDYQTAIIDLKTVLQEQPQNGQARYMLGVAQLEITDYAAAEKELLEAQKLGVPDEQLLPPLSTALRAMQRTELLSELDPSELSDPSDIALVRANQALGALASGNAPYATAFVESALESDPDNVVAIVANARIAAAQFEEDFALEELDRALATDETYAPAWTLLGDLQLKQNQLAEAEASYTKAIEYSYDKAPNLLKRLQARFRLEDIEGAKADLALLKPTHGQFSMVNYIEGMLLLRDGQEDAAMEALERAVAANSRNSNAQYYLARLKFEDGNTEMAENHGRVALAQTPNSPEVRKLLARVALQRLDFDEAGAVLQPVFEAGNADAEAKLILAEIELRKANVDHAIQLLREVDEEMPDTPAVQLQLGLALLRDGQEAAALERFETARRLDNQFELAHVALVEYWAAKGDEGKTAEAIKAYLAAVPDTPSAYTASGNAYLVLEQQDQAREYFLAAVSLDKAYPDANYALADLAMLTQDYAAAREYLGNVLAVNATDLRGLMSMVELEALERNGAQVQRNLILAAESHPNVAEPQLMLGRLYLQSGRADKVAGLMTGLDSRQKNSPEVLEVLATADIALSNYKQAEARLQQLLEQQPDSYQGLYLLAMTQSRLGKPEDVQASLERAVAANPQAVSPRVVLVLHQAETGQIDAASRGLEELRVLGVEQDQEIRLRAAIAKARGDSETQAQLLEQLLLETGQRQDFLELSAVYQGTGDIERLIALQRKWLINRPNDPGAKMMLANALVRQGDVEEARTLFEEILEARPDNLAVLRQIAWLLFDRDPEAALRYAERAIEIAPEDSMLQETYAVALLKNGEIQRARKSMDRAIANIETNRPSVWYHAALVYSEAGDKQAAREILTDLLGTGVQFRSRPEAEALLSSLQQ